MATPVALRGPIERRGRSEQDRTSTARAAYPERAELRFRAYVREGGEKLADADAADGSLKGPEIRLLLAWTELRTLRLGFLAPAISLTTRRLEILRWVPAVVFQTHNTFMPSPAAASFGFNNFDKISMIGGNRL